MLSIANFMFSLDASLRHGGTVRSADVTVNIALSDPQDFEAGGTYFECIDKTVVLQQGEMILHLGGLKHQGVDIKAGVKECGMWECVQYSLLNMFQLEIGFD